jgi:hypothetical protein
MPMDLYSLKNSFIASTSPVFSSKTCCDGI